MFCHNLKPPVAQPGVDKIIAEWDGKVKGFCQSNFYLMFCQSNFYALSGRGWNLL